MHPAEHAWDGFLLCKMAWTVRLTAAAEADFQNVVAWTLERFADRQARLYADVLSSAIV
jgi:plasmid stabilization system protein ParE